MVFIDIVSLRQRHRRVNIDRVMECGDDGVVVFNNDIGVLEKGAREINNSVRW